MSSLSKSQQAYRWIRQRIDDGRFVPGYRLVLGAIAKELDVSVVPVREAIVALEPSLLRLAMVDPRFLSDERHPGRRLIEGVAQRSFKYNDEFSDEFNTFFQPVAESFNALNGVSVENPQPFDEALTQLETQWSGEDQQQENQRDEVLRTLRVAEERQAQADQIAYDLSLRSDLDQAPAVVLPTDVGANRSASSSDEDTPGTDAAPAVEMRRLPSDSTSSASIASAVVVRATSLPSK